MSTSVLLALLAPAHAGGLSVLQPVPGFAGRDNLIRVVGATPFTELLLFAGKDAGTYVPPECPNVEVDIANPATLPTPLVPDAYGEVVVEYHVAAKFQGRTIFLQVVDITNCVASPTTTWAIPPSTETSLSSATARLIGVDPSDWSGTSLAFPGDVDGDGARDLLVGAYGVNDGPANNAGATYLVRGPVTGDIDLALAHARLLGEGDGDWSGISVSGAGDVDGDGFDDIIVGSRYADLGAANSGAAHLVYGPVSGDLPLAQAGARLIGENADDGAGHSVAGVGDIDDDGFDDVLVGAQYNDSAGSNAGIAYLVLGPIAGDLDLGLASARLFGEENNDGAGRPIARAGDTNGDGFGDVLVAAPFNDSGGRNAGVAYLFTGPVPGDRVLGSADARIVGSEEKAFIDSVGALGDVNGDGAADFQVSSQRSDHVDVDTGRVWVVYGPVEGEVPLDDADATIEGRAKGDLAGAAVVGTGDLDGDGLGDVLVSAIGSEDDGGVQTGTTHLLLGPIWGEVELESANLRIHGVGDFDQSGGALAAGDVDADGIPDLLIGAFGSDVGGSDAGASYLFSGAALGL